MKAVLVDCTPELKRVVTTSDTDLPEWLHVHEGDPSRERLHELCSDAELILVEHTVLDPELLAACPRLRGIVFMGTGAGTYVPLEAAKRLGIQVVTTPGYGNRAVAEHAIALMFAAARQVARMDREVRSGEWMPRSGMQLHGRKVAVLGLGEIGQEFAGMAQALGMRVFGWNRTPLELPYFVSSIDHALEDADVVSLHLALTPETCGILNASRLGRLSAGAIVVNTARAQLLDETALREALELGRLGHAALDVFGDEPLPTGHVWSTLENVTLSAHAAFMTNEAYKRLWRLTIEGVVRLQRSHALC
jgi:D-3-phosphoglycerate dehydrogenase